MADFEIDVGFNTQELQNATRGGNDSGSGGGLSGIAGNVGKGIKAALTATGIIGILLNLKSVLDAIAFIVGIISTLLAYLVNQFIQFAIPFFKDYNKSLLGLTIDIVNGILTGIEFLTNALIGGINAIFGTNLEQIEIPKFNKEIILEAFEQFRETKDEFVAGKATFDELQEASKSYSKSWLDALMTKDEFEEVQELSKEAGITLREAAMEIDTAGDRLKESFVDSANNITTVASSAFNSVENALRFVEERANSITGGSSQQQNIGGGFGTISRRLSLLTPLGLGTATANTVKSIYDKNIGFREE